jgi:cold shock CspA family protein
MDPSDSVQRAVEKKVAKLEAICNCITSCRVIIEAPHRHHRRGKLFHVRIDMNVPGSEIIIDRNRHDRKSHEDVYVGIRDAFDAARVNLESYVRRRKMNVKTHEVFSHGKIIRVMPEEDYGFIETSDGREIYFHVNSFIGKAGERIEPGLEVRFFEEEGNEGPQASSVIPIGKHHLRE